MNIRERVQENIDFGLRTLIAAAMLLVLWVTVVTPASAQTDGAPPARDYVSCGHFETQEDAQEVLDSGNLDEIGIASLDADGDGIACEVAFGLEEPVEGAPPAFDGVSCGHFESQAAAQEALDSGILDENGIASLDNDGNGVACEDAFETGGVDTAPASVVSLPNTGSGAISTGDSALVLLAGFATVSLAAALVVRQGSRR